MESVTERGAADPSLSFGIEDRDHRSRLSGACYSETSTAQYIIYNGLFGTRVVLRKRLDSRVTSAPRDRFHGQSPSANPSASDPCQGLPPKTRKRTRTGSIRIAHLKLSRHRTDRTTVVRPAQPGRVPAQWARAIRSPAPVRGPTRPSLPPPFHWCEETCSQTFFPRVILFLFSCFRIFFFF